jgi:hypothetical protein
LCQKTSFDEEPRQSSLEFLKYGAAVSLDQFPPNWIEAYSMSTNLDVTDIAKRVLRGFTHRPERFKKREPPGHGVAIPGIFLTNI